MAALCNADSTAGALGEQFGISSNAVRSHLRRLERAGLVRHRRESRGVGKPTHVYEVTADGESLLSRAYAPVLLQLLGVLERHVDPDRVESWVREAGVALARARTMSSADGQTVEAAVALLRELGGVPVVEKHDSSVRIRGQCCPLATVIPEHPVACKLMESLLEQMIGVAVREHCERAERPRCSFEIRLADA